MRRTCAIWWTAWFPRTRRRPPTTTLCGSFTDRKIQNQILSSNCKHNAGTFPATVHGLLSHSPANPPCQNGRFGNLPFLASSPPGWLPCLTLVGCASSIWSQFIILSSSCQQLFSFFICIFLFQASSSTGITMFRRRLSWFFRIFICIFQRKMVKSILIKLKLWLKNTKESSPWKLLSLVAVPWLAALL